MRIFSVILVCLLILVIVGLLCYQGFVTEDLQPGDLVKGTVTAAGLVLVLFRIGRTGKISNKKVAYQKAYPEFIRSVFEDAPKLERKFYNAVHDFNQSRPAAAVKKLEALRRECRRSTELYAVTVFTALCLDDMGAYEKAIGQYDSAMSIRPNSTLASNTGLCYERLGKPEAAIAAYEKAIALKADNATALNNLGSLHFRETNFEDALEYALEAVRANPRMPQALSLAAVCCALLGDQAGYEEYYRKAVAAGYDGRKIKQAVKAYDPNF